jgi:hypothetical protein
VSISSSAAAARAGFAGAGSGDGVGVVGGAGRFSRELAGRLRGGVWLATGFAGAGVATCGEVLGAGCWLNQTAVPAAPSTTTIPITHPKPLELLFSMS